MVVMEAGQYQLTILWAALIGVCTALTVGSYRRSHSIKQLAALAACLVMLVGLAFMPEHWQTYAAASILLMCAGDTLEWWRKRKQPPQSRTDRGPA